MGEECHWRAAFKLSGNERVVFIVEGDTEVSFIQKRVIPYLYSKGFTNPMNAQKILTNRKLNKKVGMWVLNI